jgi:glutamate synthase (NADPH/NADH) small chain
MPEQSPEVRVKNFDEVACGYRLEDALVEADRCLDCADQPCVKGCPVGIDIPGFIRKMVAKNFHGAYDTITDTNLLPSVCGRVCPQESQCEGVCTVGETLEPVAIGRLERFVGDMAIREGWANVPYIQPSRFKVGIVGSGPAGMACAADMAKAGCEVIVYEAFHEPGGVLKYGIPDFRLPNSVVDVEIEKLTRLGIRFECNTLVGRLFTLEQMLTEMGFHAVFVGTGAGYPSFMGIPGESLNGVLSANEWLTRCNLMHGRDFPSYDTPLQPGKRVAVVGAGNTAMDAMRVSLRVGAEKVYCVYRRSATEAPARAEEIHHAMQEGVEFHWLTSPLELIGDAGNNVRAMRCEKMELGEPDASGRRRPLPVAGSAFELETDTVIFAIGTNANPILGQTSGLKLDKRGYIATDANLATSISGIYAGGDIVTGAATVIQAMGAGRKAARAMKAYLGLRDSGLRLRARGHRSPRTRSSACRARSTTSLAVHLA